MRNNFGRGHDGPKYVLIGDFMFQLGFRAAGLRDTGARVNFLSDLFVRALESLYPDIFTLKVDFKEFNGTFWSDTRVISLLDHFLDDNFCCS